VVVKDSVTPVLTPWRREFEEHRKEGFGHFIDEDVLRKNESTSMANLMISRMPGLQSVSTAAGATLLVSSRTPCKGLALSVCRVPNCFVTIYLDGVRVFDSSMSLTTAIDLGRLSPSDFAAAEFYPGGAILPPGLSPSGSKCGTLLLHTRDR
jgi:hypothetical protein